MFDQVTKGESQHLETRVAVLEGEVEGEKMAARHILEQTRRNGDDLAAVKMGLDRHDRRFDSSEGQVGAFAGKLDGLIRDLPKVIAHHASGARQRRKEALSA